MQSRKLERKSFLVVAITVLVLPANILSAAGYRTANFVVEAPNPQLAQKIGDAAEQYRHDLAIEWIGQPLPRWSQPCPITAEVAPTLGKGRRWGVSLLSHGKFHAFLMHVPV